MNRVWILSLLSVCMFVGASAAQTPLRTAGPELASIFNFEATPTGDMPQGWGGGPPGTIFVDRDFVHSGQRAVRLERDRNSPDMFSVITKAIPFDFAGKTIEWRGFIKTELVTEFVGLWMREDGPGGAVAFDNMQNRQIAGTRDWTEFSITLPLQPNATQIYFGFLMAGTGKAWADDLELLVDGKPVWDAPKAEKPKTILDNDHEFDAGSRVALSTLTPVQVQNLSTLGKVWGFVKYHHPAIAAGQKQWDYDLFRVMPKVLAAANRDAANLAIRDWIRDLGDVPSCTSCASLPSDNRHFDSNVRWVNDENLLGHELSQQLQNIYRSRARGSKFYISQAQNVGNPQFVHELDYPALKFPDPGYQILALYRFWNIIEYWYPNRDILEGNWDGVLAQFIPRIALAKTRDDFQLEMVQLIGKIADTHANLYSLPPQLRPPAGTCQLPVLTRFIENRSVVTGYSESEAGPATGLKVGDVIESLDGQPVDRIVSQVTPYYPASNSAARMRDIARSITQGACSTVQVGVRRGSDVSTVSAERIPSAKLNPRSGATHDRPGDTFQMLADDVAYIKLSSIKVADVPAYAQRLKQTKGLVIDIRNYPSEFVVFAIGGLLVDRPTPFARFTAGNLDNPGAFYWINTVSLNPLMPHYAGKVVVLVDEISVSQSEYTTMAFRSAPQTTVIGSMTAGADGNVSEILLPGGLRTVISGIGVFYPDKKPTQRIGIVPDVEVKPTIAGIRAGRDEVLEAALRQIQSATK